MLDVEIHCKHVGDGLDEPLRKAVRLRVVDSCHPMACMAVLQNSLGELCSKDRYTVGDEDFWGTMLQQGVVLNKIFSHFVCTVYISGLCFGETSKVVRHHDDPLVSGVSSLTLSACLDVMGDVRGQAYPVILRLYP